MGKQARYTSEHKMKVAALLAVDMTVLSASKQTNIPESTIREWLKRDEFTALVAKVRDEKKTKLSEIADDCLRIAQMGIKRLGEIMPSANGVMPVSIATGTLMDKYLLLNGDPTANIKINNLADLFRANDDGK